MLVKNVKGDSLLTVASNDYEKRGVQITAAIGKSKSSYPNAPLRYVGRYVQTKKINKKP